MTAYRKFSDSWAEDAPRTLAALATLAAVHPAIPKDQPAKTLATLAILAGGTPSIRGEQSFEKESYHTISRADGLQKQTLTPAKVAKPAKVEPPPIYAKAFAELRRGCPDKVDTARWQLCIRDAHGFLADWADQAFALDWRADDLFGLDPVAPLARYDAMGLLWCLQGDRVVGLTAAAAAIRTRTMAIVRFYRRNVDHPWARQRA